MAESYKAYFYVKGAVDHIGESPQPHPSLEGARNDGKTSCAGHPALVRHDVFLIKTGTGEVCERWERDGDTWRPRDA